ncbi:hypothetical protein [Marinicrinis lubricantis]|uniref:Uncharacterized protein n=1 Tax=Marinicrinis lubricantis TaxID=2086470 RepID=A0ABW1IL66_9BACL
MKLQTAAFVAIRLLSIYFGIQALFFLVQQWLGYVMISQEDHELERYLLLQLIPGIFMIGVSLLLWLLAKPLAYKLVPAKEDEVEKIEMNGLYPLSLMIVGLVMLVSGLPELISSLISIVAERDLDPFRIGNEGLADELISAGLKTVISLAIILYARPLTRLVSQKQCKE